MTYTKTIHSITDNPVYLQIETKEVAIASSNYHPFIMKATLLLENECFPTVIRTNMLGLSVSHSSPRV